jgi:hypothetical protein
MLVAFPQLNCSLGCPSFVQHLCACCRHRHWHVNQSLLPPTTSFAYSPPKTRINLLSFPRTIILTKTSRYLQDKYFLHAHTHPFHNITNPPKPTTQPPP